MFRIRADSLVSYQSATDLVNKLEKGKKSTVPLRVTYTIEDGKIVHDIHERSWKEWFSELFIKRSQVIEVNRRVATVVSTVLGAEKDKQTALKHIHTLADSGTELSAATIYDSLFQTQIFLAPADKSVVEGKVDIEVIHSDSTTIDADVYLLDIGGLATMGRGYVEHRPQLNAFASLANKAIERAHTRNAEAITLPVIEIPSCELKAQRVLVYNALPRRKANVEGHYTAFFKALFTNSNIAGTLVVDLPKFEAGRDGLTAAVKEIKTSIDISCRRIVFVSTDHLVVKRFRESITNDVDQ